MIGEHRKMFSSDGMCRMQPKLVRIVAVLAVVALESQSTVPSPSAHSVAPLLRIDAVVTGPHGHPIQGLRAADFEVREDGAPRPVITAEFRWVPRHSTVEVFPIQTRLDEERAARQAGTRVFAFFLDEFHVSPGASADRAREAVASFIDDKMYERDLAAVIRSLDSVSAVRFTRDRSLLHGSLSGFVGRRGDYAPRTPLEEQLVGRDPAIVRTARHRIVRASLRDLGVRLGELNADRAVVVLVSEGFPPDPPMPNGRLSDLRSFLRSSSQFHFSVYPFNPAETHEEVGHPADRERDSGTLQWLAVNTGGLFVMADAYIAGFASVFHDTHGYYALTYRPAYADGKFHPLEVRTRRRGSVRAHTSYWAATGNERKGVVPVHAPTDPVARRVLRRSSLIDTWIGVRRDAAGQAHMIITWEPRTGQSRPARTVVINARTVTGSSVFEGILEPAGTTGPAKDRARFAVPPGRVEVDIIVRDPNGTVLDTDARDFDVPDMRPSSKAGPVLLPTEIIRVRTSREWQRAINNPDATPSSARTFVRAHQLLIRARAFDPTGSAVQVSARLLNRTGHLMREIEATDFALSDGVTQFVLPLSWLAPGPYQIELAATNAHGTDQGRRLVFEVD